MSDDFHETAFDDSTLLKLEIYRSYLEAWLPVFINKKQEPKWDGRINVYDFFCGPGKDSMGKEGSPIIAIRECLKYKNMLAQNGRKVALHFSDDRLKNISQLQQLLNEFPQSDRIHIEIDRKDFKTAFHNKSPEMKNAANLLFVDQCGVKEVDSEMFNLLIQIRGSDFLFFIASSFFRRFQESPEFKRYLDTTDHLDHNTPYRTTHRVIASMYRSMVPDGVEYYLAPFSLKKGANIYGLIFGSANLLGILKFLQICWKIDPERGEANFDIDNDQLPQSGENLNLFSDNQRSTKLAVFQANLRNEILAGDFSTDKEIFRHSLENGFLPVLHSKNVVKTLIKQKRIECNAQPRLSKVCINSPRSITLC